MRRWAIAVARCHINKFLPEGYEDQGRFNLVLLTAGNVIFDIVNGDSYFRYDVVSVGQLDKVQIIDAMWTIAKSAVKSSS
ncbi:MAG: hypothetical protein KIT49_01545 [Nitrospira sp.]|nr:hypothetical protein [Nitrospira sp.]